MSVYDRSWYGRVLVERVERLIERADWERAYDEITAFERLLCDEGTMVVKFWLHISSEEQLRRFRSREKDPLRRWKLTHEDWRNREHRPAYEDAVEEMLAHTDQPRAQWQLIPAESKHYARVTVVETVADAIAEALKAAGIEPL